MLLKLLLKGTKLPPPAKGWDRPTPQLAPTVRFLPLVGKNRIVGYELSKVVFASVYCATLYTYRCRAYADVLHFETSETRSIESDQRVSRVSSIVVF
jgi:hypothetical protein